MLELSFFRVGLHYRGSVYGQTALECPNQLIISHQKIIMAEKKIGRISWAKKNGLFMWRKNFMALGWDEIFDNFVSDKSRK